MSLRAQCTPNRSKLFGSHGLRPWIQNIGVTLRYAFRSDDDGALIDNGCGGGNGYRLRRNGSTS